LTKNTVSGYPLTALHTPSGTLIADGSSFYLIDDAFKIQQRIEMPWLNLHPNSVVTDKRGAIYVGMQGFVVRLNPSMSGYKSEWFTEDDCVR
jgi:hypothetical protein